MRKFFFTIFLLPASLCFGEIAVYNGSQVVKTISESGTGTKVERFIEVIDLETSEIVVITLGKQANKNTFTVSEPAPVVITTVNSAKGKGKTYTVLAQAGNVLDELTGVTTLSYFQQKGHNLKIVAKGTTPISLPRHMLGTAHIVTTESTDGATPSSIVDMKSTLHFQDRVSRLINDAEDTLPLAVERVTTILLTQKYLNKLE